MGLDSKSPQPPSGVELLAKLRAVLGELTERPQADRRQALLRCLDEALSGLSEESLRAVLADARSAVVCEARLQPRESRGSIDGPMLETEIASLRTDRDRQREENSRALQESARLVEENARLRAEIGTRKAQPQPSSGSLEKLRVGLRKVVQGETITPESIGLPAAEERLFQLVTEVLRFVVGLEATRLSVVTDFGPGGQMSTQMGKQMMLRVRKRLADVLDDREGSIGALTATLQDNDRFLLGLSSAFFSALAPGAQEILKEVDPELILEQSKGRFMTDYEQAWKNFARQHNDLKNLTGLEIYERYFKKPFLERFGELTKSEE